MAICSERWGQVGNTWRTTQDISLAIQATWETVMNNLEGTKGLARFAGPGGWNDPDMLEVQILLLVASPGVFMKGRAGNGEFMHPEPRAASPVMSQSHKRVKAPGTAMQSLTFAGGVAGRGAADGRRAESALWDLGNPQGAARVWE